MQLLSELIRNHRKRSALTQAELAELAGVGKNFSRIPWTQESVEEKIGTVPNYLPLSALKKKNCSLKHLN